MSSDDHLDQARRIRDVRNVVTGNAAATAIFFATQSLATIVALRFVLHRFGRTDYGLYAVIMGIVMLLQVVNFGITIAVMKYVAEYHAKGDEDGLRALLGNCYIVSVAGNSIAAGVLIAIGTYGGGLLGVAKSDRPTFALLSLAVGLTTLPIGLLQVPRAVLWGLQRFGLQTKLDLVNAAGPLIAMLVTIAFSTNYATFVAVNQATTIFSGLLILHATRRLLPYVRHVPRFERKSFAAVFAFNMFQVVNQVADILFYTSDRLVLQWVVGTATVGNYSVIERPRIFADSGMSIPLAATVPAVSKAYAEDDDVLVDRFVNTGTRMYLRLVLCPVLVILALMPGLLRTWLGGSYTNLAIYAQLFLAGSAAAAPFQVFAHVLVGKGRLRELVATKTAFAPLNLVASYLLARHIGLVGVILPTLTYWAVVNPVLCLLLMRSEGLSLARFGRTIASPIVTMVIWSSAVLVAGAALAGQSGVLQIVLAIAGVLGGYLVSILTIVDPRERELVLDVLLRFVRRATTPVSSKQTPT